MAAVVGAGVGTGAPARADAAEHELRTGGAVVVKVGERGAGSLTIVPGSGRSIHDAALTVRLSVEPAEGLRLERRRYGRADAADPRADAPRFDLAFVADKPGRYDLVAEARFWLCARRTCVPIRDRARIPVVVEPITP